MKTIVIQRFNYDLFGIKKSVTDFDNKADIVYTSDPERVLREIKDIDPIFVVSGQVFDRHYDTRFGTDLARAIKKINPKALFFIYSMTPEWNEFVDGLIPKERDPEYSLLAKILTSNLEGVTPADLGLSFPEITVLSHIFSRPKMTVRVEKDF